LVAGLLSLAAFCRLFYRRNLALRFDRFFV